jgi:hypothetical protein
MDLIPQAVINLVHKVLSLKRLSSWAGVTNLSLLLSHLEIMLTQQLKVMGKVFLNPERC